MTAPPQPVTPATDTAPRLHLGDKVHNVFMGDVKRVISEELINSEQQIQERGEPCKPGISEPQLDELVC